MNKKLISRIPGLAKFGLASLAAFAAVGVAGTGVAHAADSNLSLGTYSIPPRPPPTTRSATCWRRYRARRSGSWDGRTAG